MKKELFESAQVRQFFKAVLALESEEECRIFFDDILTLNELKALSQRLEVARLLKGEATFAEIAEKTGMSSATISRVNRCLKYGEGGYKTVLERIEQKSE